MALNVIFGINVQMMHGKTDTGCQSKQQALLLVKPEEKMAYLLFQHTHNVRGNAALHRFKILEY